MLPAESMEQHLSRLRRAIATSEALPEQRAALTLGIGTIDAALGGGLECAALHELSTAPGQFDAAGFAIALATLAREPGKQTLWIATDFGMRETGALYGPGLDQFGLDTRRLLIAHVPRPIDALFAMEEALRCRALATVVAELADGAGPHRNAAALARGARRRRAWSPALPQAECRAERGAHALAHRSGAERAG